VSTRWAEVTIAGVEIRRPGGEWSRVEIQDAEALAGVLAGSNTVALDSTVHLQLTDRGLRGVRFRARVAQLSAAVLHATVAAMEASLSSGAPFPFVGSDESGVDDIDVLCFPDYEALGGSGRLYTRGPFSGGFVKEVVFPLITTGAND
jgi:hypothetical protein